MPDLPEFEYNGVLPPFLPGNPTSSFRSPYRISIFDFVERFGFSADRRTILAGLINYRALLFERGFNFGYQWLDGSFVENSELIRGRPPRDIDVVTLFHRPLAYGDHPDRWNREASEIYESLFDSTANKARFHCDTYPLDLDSHPMDVVINSNYYSGLFSHQRVTFLWKGMIEIPLMNDPTEPEALDQLLEEMGARHG